MKALEPHNLDKELSIIARLRNEALAPISRLPDDILSDIFSIPYLEECSTGLSEAYARAVSTTSTRWRAVAVNTPYLWATVALGQRPIGRSFACARLPRCTCCPRHLITERRGQTSKEWISRAKSVPLSLHIGRYARFEASGLVDFIVSGASSSPSIRHLYWSIPFMALLHRTVSHCQETLEVLHLIRYDSPFNALDMDVLFSASMPSLREVALRAIPLPRQYNALSNCKMLSFSFSRDTVSYLNHLLQILRTCDRLEHLEISRDGNFDVWQDAFAANATPVLLDRLDVLHLDEGKADGRGLLACIRAPSLRVLALTLSYGLSHARREISSETGILPFLAHSSRVIDLRFPNLQPLGLIDVLRAAPELQSLALHWSAEEYIAFFHGQQRRLAHVCPNLRTLKLSAKAMTDPGVIDAFVREMQLFLRSRQASSTALSIHALELVVAGHTIWDKLHILSNDVERFSYERSSHLYSAGAKGQAGQSGRPDGHVQALRPNWREYLV